MVQTLLFVYLLSQKGRWMNKLLLILYLFAIGVFTGNALSKEVEIVELGNVSMVLYDTKGLPFVVSETGIWQVNHNDLIRLSDGQTLPKPESFVQIDTININGYLEGALYLVSLLLILFLYLYYQADFNRKRKLFYQKITEQQNLLSIAYMATGDEIIDCNVRLGKAIKINPNAKLVANNELYFKSDSYIDSIHDEDVSMFNAKFDSILRGMSNNYEIIYRRKIESSWVWVAERGSVIERDVNGTAVRLVACLRDVSDLMEQKQQLIELTSELEKRLRRSEAMQK